MLLKFKKKIELVRKLHQIILSKNYKKIQWFRNFTLHWQLLSRQVEDTEPFESQLQEEISFAIHLPLKRW